MMEVNATQEDVAPLLLEAAQQLMALSKDPDSSEQRRATMLLGASALYQLSRGKNPIGKLWKKRLSRFERYQPIVLEALYDERTTAWTHVIAFVAERVGADERNVERVLTPLHDKHADRLRDTVFAHRIDARKPKLVR
ncbi:MAG: hypothetical protein ABI843_15960 [Dokdonella sp.]